MKYYEEDRDIRKWWDAIEARGGKIAPGLSERRSQGRLGESLLDRGRNESSRREEGGASRGPKVRKQKASGAAG